MEAWLELILILSAFALSIASILISIRLYVYVKKPPTISTEGGGVKHKGSRYVKRYMVFRIYRIGGETSFEDLDRCLKSTVAEHLGIMEDVERNLKLVRYNAQSGVGVMRIVSTDIYKVIFAVSRLRRCGGSALIVMPLLITGTLKRAISRAQEYEGKYR